MADTIKSLKAALSQNTKERARIQNQIETLEDEKLIPALRKKYEGRVFKYENGYSADVRWPVYVWCHKIKSPHEAIVTTFQLIPNEGWRFSIKSTEGIFMLQTEITSTDYHQAACEILAAANKI